jgi:hypothetical protein
MQFKNNNNLYYLIFIVLLALAAVFYFSNQDSTLNKKYADFTFQDTSRVSSIVIKDSAQEVELVRGVQSWMVNNKLPAKNRTVKLLLKIFSQLSIKSAVSKGKLSEMQHQLETRAVQVSFMDNGKIIKKYYVSDYFSENETYMSIGNTGHPYSMDVLHLQGRMQALLNTDINFWRDNVIFRCKPDDIASVSVEYPLQPFNSFKLSKLDNGMWTLTDIKGLKTFALNDKRRLMEYLSSFGNVAFEKIVSGIPRHSSDSILSSKPLYIISLKDNENRMMVMKGFPISLPNLKNEAGRQLNSDPDRLFVFINNCTDLAVAKYLDIDPISKSLDYFLTK